MSEPYEEPRAGQEAAKLLAAAQDWLRTSAPHVAPLDAEGRTCACPLCRIVAGVRDADPVALGSWVDAAVAAATTTLAQAAETLAPPAADRAADDAEAGPTGRGASAADDDDVDDDADGYLEDVEDLEDLHDLRDEAGDDDVTDEREQASARQDDEGSRRVRRIPLEQTEPGDLDG